MAPVPPRRQPNAPTVEAVHWPASTSGLNTITAGSQIQPTEAIQLYNLISAEYGNRARLGYQEHVTGLTGATDNLVRTHIPFTGKNANGSTDKLFVTTSSGIWDVTSSGSVTTAWATATAYDVGDFVTAASTVYGCKVAGTSHASAPLPSVWTALTAYVIGDRVINDSNCYICTANGTSAGAGGPTGTGSGITDGTVTWNFQSESSSVSDGTVTWHHSPNNVAPTLVYAFGDTTGDAGYGIFTTFTNTAGHWCFYADEQNGLYRYDETNGYWEKGSTAAAVPGTSFQMTGVDPAELVFVLAFKTSLWFVQKNTDKAWYAASLAVSGALTAFRMGHKFRAGGGLRALASWTYDGGAGIDDSLVGVSDGGDVLVWQLTDPSVSQTTLLKGVWYAGALVSGREVLTPFGGDVLILSKIGARPLSSLVMTGITEDTSQYATQKIGNLFNVLALSKGSKRGWSIRIHPEDNSLIITVPTEDGDETEQLVMSFANKAWSRYRDLPIYSSGVFGGSLYFGTADGRVCKNTGYVDNVTLADPDAYTSIQWSMLTGFQSFGNGRQKQVQLIRPTILCDGGVPSYEAQARFKYDLSEIGTVAEAVQGGSVWNTGVWDTDVWSGEFVATQQATGAQGVGPEFALAMRGTANSRTIIVGTDVFFTQGGML
jgi:hypothetical protein